MENIKLYNDEIELIFDEAKHLYTVNGEPVTGVTGALQTIAKPALLYWAVNMAIQYLEKKWIPGVGYDEIQIQKTLAEAKKAHRVFKKEAGDIGTLIHQWIEKWIKGEEPATPVNEVMKKATDSFLEWVDEFKIEFLHSERKVYSKKYGYAGTCDFVAKVHNETIVGDIKTSSGIYPEMHFQTAAYQQALQEEFPDMKFEANVIIRCGKDGTFEISETEDFDKNIKAFLGALAIYNRQQDLKTKEMYGKK